MYKTKDLMNRALPAKFNYPSKDTAIEGEDFSYDVTEGETIELIEYNNKNGDCTVINQSIGSWFIADEEIFRKLVI